MGKYSKEVWYFKEKEKYISKYGDIPPHWIIFPNSHPYSIMWRMGGGETFDMVFSNWFEDHFKVEKNKVDFFLKYSPPPRWLQAMASYIWGEIPIEGFENSEYIQKLKMLGFSATEKYLSDLEDPKWLEFE